MAAPSGWTSRDCAVVTFQPVSDMLNVGRCEPLKAAVHGVLMATVAICAAYNAAAWLKRRQPHLAVNAIVYTTATLWEHAHVLHHLIECQRVPEPSAQTRQTADPVRNAA